MVIVSHDMESKLNFDSVCSVAGGDNADRFVFRWVNLKAENRCFCKECNEKVYWLPSLLILFFIVASC